MQKFFLYRIENQNELSNQTIEENITKSTENKNKVGGASVVQEASKSQIERGSVGSKIENVTNNKAVNNDKVRIPSQLRNCFKLKFL